MPLWTIARHAAGHPKGPEASCGGLGLLRRAFFWKGNNMEPIVINTVINTDKELERLEGVIRKNLAAFYEVGQALMAIRDKRLYLHKNGGKYQTFEAYCQGVWDFNSSRARQLIMATEALENVKSVTSGNTPSSERQARPLSKLEPEQQRQAWQKAVETAPEGKVTAAHVARVVKGMTEPEEEKGDELKESYALYQMKRLWKSASKKDRQRFLERIDQRAEAKNPHSTCTEAMQFAVIAISQLERIRDDDPEKVMVFNWIKDWINIKTQDNTATDAMQFAMLAISAFERTRFDDPDRVNALNRVKNWINNRLK